MKRNARHLPEKMILRGKYMIEDVLGEGGFGITYLATDLDLERKVAIKEFCPREYAGRDANDGMTIIPFDDAESQDLYEREKEKFIQEARRLAKFYNLPGVVSVLDYFSDYGTAYLVMDYIEGVTISQYMKREGKLMTVEETLTLMQPVMESIEKMHEAGIMHRDISPDNIMISKDLDKVYLIDFGTARSTDIESNRSLSVYKKGGFTPLEQQSTHGNQGPWTDVYELCATIYKCITGRVPQEAVDRVGEDGLVRPSACGVAISSEVEEVLLAGLAVYVKDRIQSMKELAERFAKAQEEMMTAPILEELPPTMPARPEPKPLPKVEAKPVVEQAQTPKQSVKRYSRDEIRTYIAEEEEAAKAYGERMRPKLVPIYVLAFVFFCAYVSVTVWTTLYVGYEYGVFPGLLAFAGFIGVEFVLKRFIKLDKVMQKVVGTYYGKLCVYMCKETSELQAQAEIYMMRNSIEQSTFLKGAPRRYARIPLQPQNFYQYYDEVLCTAKNVSEETKAEWKKEAKKNGFL